MDRPDYVDDQTWEQTKKNVAAAKPAPKPKRVPEATDDAIAEAFAEEHRDDLRYVAAWGKWFEWRDGCWREEKTLRAFDLIRKTCRAQGLRRTGMAKMVAAVHALTSWPSSMMPMMASQVFPFGGSSISLNTFSSRATCSSVSVACSSKAAFNSCDFAAFVISGRALRIFFSAK
jgi:D5 N terminal like